MRVIFSHGKESGPNGEKIQALGRVCDALGIEWESLDYRGLDAEGRRARLIAHARHIEEPVVLVGSSMGAWVSLAALSSLPQVCGLFLLAPAVGLEGYPSVNYPHVPTHIIHGWNDDVVPVENVIEFASKQGPLQLIDDGHRLSSPSSIEAVTDALTSVLTRLKVEAELAERRGA